MNTGEMKFIRIILFSLFFFVSFYIFYNQTHTVDITKYPSDLPTHIVLAEEWIRGDVNIPHPIFHITIFLLSKILFLKMIDVAPLLLAFMVIFSQFIMLKILRRYLGKLHSEKTLLYILTGLFLISAIWLPMFSKYIYLGQGTMNIWHNPTIIMLKPVILLAFLLCIDLIQNQNNRLRNIILVGFLLCLSVLIKPNFILVFLPALVIFFVIKRSELKLSQFWKSLWLFIPVVIILLIQYLSSYGDDSDAAVQVKYLVVWKLYSPHPLVSVLLTIGFPLGVLLFRYKKVKENNFLLISWFGLIFGVLQYAFLAEGGERFADANFSWGMQSILPMLFIFSIIEFFKWSSEIQDEGKHYRFTVVSVLLSLHVISGLYYTLKIITGEAFG